MKFYYEGKLIRTSKTHDYKYALLSENGTAVRCSSTYEGCDKELSSWITQLTNGIKNCESLIKAYDEGRNVCVTYKGNRQFYEKIDKYSFTREEAIKRLEDRKKSLSTITNEWKIVELECKA